jgi:hypothetical protein
MKISDFSDSLNQEQRDTLIDRLDELLHDAKASEAAAINNDGIEAQAEYLGLDAAELADLVAKPVF